MNDDRSERIARKQALHGRRLALAGRRPLLTASEAESEQAAIDAERATLREEAHRRSVDACRCAGNTPPPPRRAQSEHERIEAGIAAMTGESGQPAPRSEQPSVLRHAPAPAPARRRNAPRARGAGTPAGRAVARSSSRGGDSGDDGSGSSSGDGDPPPPPEKPSDQPLAGPSRRSGRLETEPAQNPHAPVVGRFRERGPGSLSARRLTRSDRAVEGTFLRGSA